jgi:hypothetical protein
LSWQNQTVTWLKKNVSEPRKALARFTTGGFLFAGGIMVLIFVEKLMESSVSQEIVAILALVMTVLGATLALWGYLGISFFKIIIYILDKDERRD